MTFSAASKVGEGRIEMMRWGFKLPDRHLFVVRFECIDRLESHGRRPRLASTRHSSRPYETGRPPCQAQGNGGTCSMKRFNCGPARAVLRGCAESSQIL